MIGQVFTYLINVVGLLLSKLADFEIVTNVNLLNTLIVWNLIILVISLLNKLSKGSGNPKGNSVVSHSGSNSTVTRSGNVVNRNNGSNGYEYSDNGLIIGYKK